jgi:hypothetical protein
MESETPNAYPRPDTGKPLLDPLHAIRTGDTGVRRA